MGTGGGRRVIFTPFRCARCETAHFAPFEAKRADSPPVFDLQRGVRGLFHPHVFGRRAALPPLELAADHMQIISQHAVAHVTLESLQGISKNPSFSKSMRENLNEINSINFRMRVFGSPLQS